MIDRAEQGGSVLDEDRIAVRDKMVDVLNRRSYLRNLLRDIDEVLEELRNAAVRHSLVGQDIGGMSVAGLRALTQHQSARAWQRARCCSSDRLAKANG